MFNNDMSPMKDICDKIYTVHACLTDLGRVRMAKAVIKNKTRLESYARFACILAVKQNRMDLVEELEFAGFYG